MEKILIKYRTWYQGQPPKPIKLQIPGWAGEPNDHTNGDKPQPWHCIPFVEGSTYGLELYYPFDTECHVSIKDGKVCFDGDFTEESLKCPNVPLPPFLSFSPGHFGMTSALDIKVPAEYVLRLEPHPRFYTDETNTVPCCIPGHLQTEWWSKIFFVVFKNPIPNQTIIFRKGEPFGQILIVPKKINYEIQEMTNAEILERSLFDTKIEKYAKNIAKNDWHDYKGNNFDDKYKVLGALFSKGGMDAINQYIDKKSVVTKMKIKNKFIKRKK